MTAAQAPAPRSLAGDRDGSWVRHWQHPQWLADVDRWVHGALAEHHIRPTGPASTYKIRFWSVVRCYPTDAGLYWFKENHPGQAFEARLVATLADLVPDQVAPPLAVRDPRVRGDRRHRGPGRSPHPRPHGQVDGRRRPAERAGHPARPISLPWTAGLAEDRVEVTELVEAYLSAWSDLADLEVLRREHRLAAALLPVARVISWYRILDHADLTEIAAWIESPRHWLGAVAALAG